MMGSKSHGAKGERVPPPADDEMRLYVWDSGWNMPSIDPASLQIMAYIKFCGAPVTILTCENPWKSPKGILPFFQQGVKVLYSPPEILSYLRQKNYSCDFGLSLNESGQVIAYTNLIMEALDPALQYYCWIDASNYGSVMRPCIGRRIPWLYKSWYAESKRRSALNLIDAVSYPVHGDYAAAEPVLLKKAQECIAVLSDKLSSQEFFLYPNSPSALDAIVFSYLAAFLQIPISHSPVRESILLTPNLERFVSRIRSRYFLRVRGIGDGAIRSESNFGLDGHPTTKSSDETIYPLHQKLSAIGIGLGIMLAFAYFNGLLVGFGFHGSSMEEDVDETDDDENLIWE